MQTNGFVYTGVVSLGKGYFGRGRSPSALGGRRELMSREKAYARGRRQRWRDAGIIDLVVANRRGRRTVGIAVGRNWVGRWWVEGGRLVSWLAGLARLDGRLGVAALPRSLCCRARPWLGWVRVNV